MQELGSNIAIFVLGLLIGAFIGAFRMAFYKSKERHGMKNDSLCIKEDIKKVYVEALKPSHNKPMPKLPEVGCNTCINFPNDKRPGPCTGCFAANRHGGYFNYKPATSA